MCDPAFTAELTARSVDDLRGRRTMATEAEHEVSYYRRLLLGRLDLIAHERKFRAGETARTLVDALPDILADEPSQHSAPSLQATALNTDAPYAPIVGKRRIDTVLSDGFLAEIDTLDDTALDAVEHEITTETASLTEQRTTIHGQLDRITAELAQRHASGNVDIDDLIDR